MKNVIKLSLMVLMAATIFSACKNEAPNGLAVKYLSEKIAAEGGTATFTIYPGSFDKWSIDIQNIEWLQLSSTEGEGETEVTATVLPNEAENDREALVIVTAGDRKIPVIIKQAGAGLYFNVTPLSVTAGPGVSDEEWFVPDEGSVLTVTSNMCWYAEIEFVLDETGESYEFVDFGMDEYMFTYGSAAEPICGNDEITLYFIYWPFSVGQLPRTAIIHFYNTDGELLKDVVVTQNPEEMYFQVTPDALSNLPAAEGQFIERVLVVTTNILWRAEITFNNASDGEWVHILPDELLSYSHYGDFALHLRIDNYLPPAPTAPTRTAKVSFYNEYNDALLKEVIITQNP